MPHLVEVQERYGGADFTVVGVTEATADQTRSFVDEHELNFPVLSGAMETRESFGVDLIWGTVFFLVDPDGQIVADSLGAAEEVLEARSPG